MNTKRTTTGRICQCDRIVSIRTNWTHFIAGRSTVDARELDLLLTDDGARVDGSCACTPKSGCRFELFLNGVEIRSKLVRLFLLLLSRFVSKFIRKITNHLYEYEFNIRDG